MLNVSFPIEKIRQILNEKMQILQDLQQVVFIEAAEKMQTSIDERVFSKGLNSNNETIGTGSATGTKYNTQYAQARQKQGLQIGFIDFTVTGQLKRSIDVIREVNGGERLVISNSRNVEIADNLDKIKGANFYPTKTEIEDAKKYVVSEIKRMKRRNKKNAAIREAIKDVNAGFQISKKAYKAEIKTLKKSNKETKKLLKGGKSLIR